MAAMEAQVNYAALSDAQIAEMGLAAAAKAFARYAEEGLLIDRSLAMCVGEVDDQGRWVELGRMTIGPDGEKFLANIDPITGKLATAIHYRMDSVAAKHLLGDLIPKGPQSWTGAVHFPASVETADGWLGRTFVGAASGVQGHFDAAITYVALAFMAACWALREQARRGKPKP